MGLNDSKKLNEKYVGKEVICSSHKNARIYEVTGHSITIKADDGFYVYDTGTGPNDNAVANGYIKFVDETLQKEFVEEYEKYVRSESGLSDAFLYYSQIYD